MFLATALCPPMPYFRFQEIMIIDSMISPRFLYPRTFNQNVPHETVFILKQEDEVNNTMP